MSNSEIQQVRQIERLRLVVAKAKSISAQVQGNGWKLQRAGVYINCEVDEMLVAASQALLIEEQQLESMQLSTV